MKKQFLVLILTLSIGMALLTLITYLPAAADKPANAAPQPVWPDAVPGGLYTSRRSDGVLSLSNQSIFGPHICTAYGDPFSPLNSVWAPGLYTYTYRIRIPADYAEDVIRVELFDPDSKNRPGNSFLVQHTQLAQVNGGFPLTQTLSCDASSSAQRDPCLIVTGEANTPGSTVDSINPYWFVRIDENRGSGTPPGDGSCGIPGSYTAGYNTQTYYELSYYADQGGGTPMKVPLASYTGQTGDARDIGPDQDTDLRWVSPGGQLSGDQTVPVPTDCGSPNGGDYEPATCPGGSAQGAGSGFEVSLTQDLAGIVADPETGDRHLYLNVTARSGASENGFEIWAGPNTYVSAVPSDANQRNVYILDNPGSHDAAGITPLAVDYLPLNSNEDLRQDVPLAYIGPEYAGQVISITLFDSDGGAAPPLHVYFDSIARADWEATFAPPGPHSCYPGSCNDQWVTPPFTITVPGDISQCDYQNPDPGDCTPFTGGRLMADYDGALHDTFVWEIDAPPQPAWDSSLSCAAFPIAGHELISSVNPPGSPTNPYPNPNDFDNPNPPVYTDFPDHQPDLPLADAQEGTLYRYYQGFGAGEFGWLIWNNGIALMANTLENSLTWPGDTFDYTDHGDVGQPATPLYPNVVRGYVNPNDTLDLALQIGDYVPANTGSVNSSGMRAVVEEHIVKERQLRLLIWDTAQNPGVNGSYRVARFAVFRLQGYHLSQASGGSWLLLEFIRWDDSCGQVAGPVTDVALSGPAAGNVGTAYQFTAQVTPATAATPITYTWQASGQVPVTHTAGLTDTAVFTWTTWGTQAITVTAVNHAGSAATASHTIDIAPFQLRLPIALKPN